VTAEPKPAPPATIPVSACILAYQEIDRIADCVRSAAFCEQIVVIDSGSTDGTRECAAALGAEVVLRAPFPGFKAQRQAALDLARHDWVLLLDADERVTDELRARIVEQQRAGFPARGYEFPRRNHYLGGIVRRGLWWPDRKLRLVDRRHAWVGGVDPHDVVELRDGAAPARLEAPLEHLNYRDFRAHLRTIDRYTAEAARNLVAAGRRVSLLDLVLRPPAVFVKSLVLKRGFLDGWRGVLVAATAFWYDLLKYARALRLAAKRGRP
jgi:glycosyltransferase involved in cell wall biosynthesis